MSIENIADIESLIRLDRKDNSYKDMLFKALISVDVYILASTEYVTDDLPDNLTPANEDRPPDAEDTHLAITLWEDEHGNAAIPFFSSIEILQDSIDQEETYVCMNAGELFALTKGTPLILNPISEYHRSFSIDDVEHMLSLKTEHSS